MPSAPSVGGTNLLEFELIKRASTRIVKPQFFFLLLSAATVAVLWTSDDINPLSLVRPRAIQREERRGPDGRRGEDTESENGWSSGLFSAALGNDTGLTDTQREVLEDLDRRRWLVQKVCNSSQHVGKMQNVFLYGERRLAYCFVPKTGCTFWKRVFTFLSQDKHKVLKGFKTPFTSPFHIPRLHVHMYTRTRGVKWMHAKNRTRDYLRFMFARDPYTRLWSDYLDKFFLPDFWTRFAKRILSKRRPKSPGHILACGNGVTFQEFVEFALHFDEPHWTPVSSTCDPCKFRPHVIGKMETYSRDARAVLDQTGLGWILDGVGHPEHVKNEVETLVEYNFQKIHKKSPELGRDCITDQELGWKLWTVFQYNGYISGDMPFVAASPFSKSAFIQQVMQAIEDSSRNGTKLLKLQKARVLDNAFRQLPKDLLKKIEQRYALDFEMFEYSPRSFD